MKDQNLRVAEALWTTEDSLCKGSEEISRFRDALIPKPEFVHKTILFIQYAGLNITDFSLFLPLLIY